MLEDPPPPLRPPDLAFLLTQSFMPVRKTPPLLELSLKAAVLALMGGEKKHVLPFKLKIKINITEEKKKRKSFLLLVFCSNRMNGAADRRLQALLPAVGAVFS